MHLIDPDLGMPNDNKATGSHSSIRRSLILWFILLAVIPTTLAAFFIYQKSRETLIQLATEKLQQSSMLTMQFLDIWFANRLSDLANQAEAKRNASLLQELIEGFRGSNLDLDEYVGSPDWKLRVGYAQSDLVALNKRYDFLYDLFLIDNEGNILFSVRQEADLGTNLRSGPYAHTLFAKSVEEVLNNRETSFSDLERYAPSNNVVTGFLAAPIYDNFGSVLGTFAMQLRFDGISTFLNNQENMRLSHYLIGDDGILRTAIGQNQRDILVKKIGSFDKTNSPKLNSVKNLAAGAPSNTQLIESTAHTYLGPSGQSVIGLHNTINLLGSNWILVSEIDESDALGLANLLGISALSIALITAFLAAGIALLLARRFTDPLIKLAEIAEQVATGQQDIPIDIKSDNEIGRLANAFKRMLKVQQQNEEKLKTSHTATEKALADLVEQRSALDQHAIVAITDVKGLITHTNEKFCEISGYSKDELIGQNHRIINSGFHEKNFWKEMYRTIASGEVWHGEVCNRAKNGQLYWVDTTIAPFKGQDGKPNAYVAIRTDITKIKQTEQELIAAIEAAEQANQAKSNFLATMSHEIRTPMNGVIGMLSLLTQTSLNKDQLRKAQVAHSSAESLLNLLNEILDFSKVDAHKLELEEIDFSLRDLFEKFAETMAFKAEEKGLELILNITGIDTDVVKGDPGRIRQILTNLVGNAIKFTTVGEIVIRAQLEDVEKGHILTCHVQDTGIGIPQSKLKDLFDPFTQVDASTTRNFGGTGLGLAIVKKLCNLMNGNVEITSKVGRGSDFCFTAKLATGDQVRLNKPAVNLEGLNVLIVDDNSINREVLREQLQQWGCNTVEAESGQHALELCSESLGSLPSSPPLFEVALLDFLMPDMDGAELGKRLRTNPRFDSLKLVMMTSASRQGDAQYFANLKFDAYLPKPVSMSLLLDTLTVLHDEGEALDQASPLVTQHYLDFLLPEADNPVRATNKKQINWPENTKLLIVEDNPVNQEVVAGMLDTMGLANQISSDGIEALVRLQEINGAEAFSLILMDCQMPRKDGYETTREIRSGEAGAQYVDIPIIAMTANAMKGDRKKCLDAGMNDYLAKPLLPKLLTDMLEKWLLDRAAIVSIDKIEEASKPKKDTVWDKRQVLVRVDNNQTQLIRLVKLFLENMPGRIEELAQGVEERDNTKIAHSAHTIKGIAANLDCIQLSDLASRMEISAKENVSIDPIDLFRDLRNANDLVRHEFEKFLSGHTVSQVENPQNSAAEIIGTLSKISARLKENEYIESEEIDALADRTDDVLLRQYIKRLSGQIASFEQDEALFTIDEIFSKHLSLSNDQGRLE